MRRILSVLFGSSVFVLLVFLVFADIEGQILDLLKSPLSMAAYALLSFCFLLSDILLPVPSSLVMILNGKVLGVFWGTILSVGSGMASSMIGYLLGRRSAPHIDRFFSPEEQDSGNRFFIRYGGSSVALSKALPVLSESISFLSGTTQLDIRSFIAYSLCGHTVVSLVYAYAGSVTNAYDSSVISAIVIVGTLALAWVLSRFLMEKPRVS